MMPQFVSDEVVSLFGIQFSPGYLYALVAGGVILLIFAYRQLNRPSYELAEDQRRFLATLMPADIGGGRAFFRAYAFYALTLLSLFLFFSILIPLIPGADKLFGLDTVGLDTQKADFDAEGFPLAISLIMVGLGPSVPFLKSIEETFRRMAHRLVGIPDNIFDIAQRIRNIDLSPTDATQSEKRLLAQASQLSSGATELEEVHNEELTKLIAHLKLAKAWLFDVNFVNQWPPQSIRNRYSHSFKALEKDMETAISATAKINTETQEFLHKYGNNIEDSGAGEEASVNKVDLELKKVGQHYIAVQWEEVMSKANSAWTNASTVLALYAVNAPAVDGILSPLLRQTIMTARASRQRPVLDIVVKSILVVYLIVFLISLVFSYAELITSGRSLDLPLSPVWTAITYALGALILYTPASLIAWVRRSGQVRQVHWTSADFDLWRFPTIQYLKMFLTCYITTIICIIFYTICVRYILSADKTTVIDLYFQSNSIYVTAAWSLLGALQGCFLCFWLDITEKHRKLKLAITALLGGLQALVFAFAAVFSNLVADEVLANAVFAVILSMAVGFVLGFLTLQNLGSYRESLEKHLQSLPDAGNGVNV